MFFLFSYFFDWDRGIGLGGRAGVCVYGRVCMYVYVVMWVCVLMPWRQTLALTLTPPRTHNIGFFLFSYFFDWDRGIGLGLG